MPLVPPAPQFPALGPPAAVPASSIARVMLRDLVVPGATTPPLQLPAQGSGQGAHALLPARSTTTANDVPPHVAAAMAAFANVVRVLGLATSAASLPRGAWLWELIQPGSVAPDGLYHVRLFWAGCWRRVTVSDALPVSASGFAMFPISEDERELWPSLLWKAWWALSGLGDSLAPSASAVPAPLLPAHAAAAADACDPLLILHALTGWLPQRLSRPLSFGPCSDEADAAFTASLVTSSLPINEPTAGERLREWALPSRFSKYEFILPKSSLAPASNDNMVSDLYILQSLWK